MVRAWIAIFVLSFAVSTSCSLAYGDDVDEGREASARNDYATAMSKFTDAAEQGNANGQYELATLYHDGHGVPRDLGRAVYWYTHAAEQGNTPAQYWLCVMHREGIGVPRDYSEAFYWCHRAAEKGHAAAMFAVGQFYFDGLGNGFIRDHVRAYIWFTLADAQGDEDAQSMLETLEEDMTPQQIAEAQRLARKWTPGGKVPCSSNNPRARFC